ncbi:hypothetical protein L1987_02441 [Smallanthus sonchifolius]|uniref:Uncharacterized protein n=1 Tax=Smallanthus sonchifolius TaxID=185202 RepID=A0ACB9K7Z7_9ASTR|nr:hypothetical protein L1987_02441 [Smallanthus sonchifolius]
MSDSRPKKDGKLGGKLDQLLELEMQEGGKVDRILELVQEVVANQNNTEFGEGHHTDSVEGGEEEEVNTDHVKNDFDEDYAAAYGTPGPSVEVLGSDVGGRLRKSSS